MITDKKLGLKVAENPEEAFWTKTKENAQAEIDNNLRINLMNKEIIKLCDRMISAEKGK